MRCSIAASSASSAAPSSRIASRTPLGIAESSFDACDQAVERRPGRGPELLARGRQREPDRAPVVLRPLPDHEPGVLQAADAEQRRALRHPEPTGKRGGGLGLLDADRAEDREVRDVEVVLGEGAVDRLRAPLERDEEVEQDRRTRRAGRHGAIVTRSSPRGDVPIPGQMSAALAELDELLAHQLSCPRADVRGARRGRGRDAAPRPLPPARRLRLGLVLGAHARRRRRAPAHETADLAPAVATPLVLQ